MDIDVQNEHHRKEMSRQACLFAENLVKSDLGRDVLAEAVQHRSIWSEFRMVFSQNMGIWQDFTTVTLAVTARGSVAGWLVEKRKADCGRPIIPDAQVETRARTVEQIRDNFLLQGVRHVSIGGDRSMAVASFAGPARTDAYEVFINPTTGELIGFLPTPVGMVSPAPTDDADAKAAEELAWKQIEAGLLNRVGPDAVAQSRKLLKLTPMSAIRDDSGGHIRIFRLWQFFTACEVSLDEATREIVGWYVEAFQANAPERRIDETIATQAAFPELKAEEGVQGPNVSFTKVNKEEKATVHWWHAENGINVEGDQTTVFVNTTTGKAFAAWRKWRKIPRDLLKPPAVSQEQALAVADRSTKRAPTEPRGEVLGQNIIQISSDPEQPGPVRDVLVWRVGYQENGGIGFTEVSVDCQTGEPVRVTGW